jgi:quercetin dioxygenase-like cupin family protein
MAHIIRVKPGAHAGFGWHKHELDFQMYYVLKGWVKFNYEGVGEVLAEAGSCVHQPPGIRHAEIAHSDDLELIEITLPAEFETVEVDAPAEAAKEMAD